jgi:hypothetical protein
MAWEDTGLTVSLKHGFTIACAADTLGNAEKLILPSRRSGGQES